MGTSPRRHRRKTIEPQISHQENPSKPETHQAENSIKKESNDSHPHSNITETIQSPQNLITIQKGDFDDFYSILDFPQIEVETSDLYPSFKFDISDEISTNHEHETVTHADPIFNLTNSTMLSEFNRKNRDQNLKTEIDIDNVSIASSFMSEISALAFSSNTSTCFSTSSSSLEKKGLSKHSHRNKKTRNKQKFESFDYRKNFEDPTMPTLFENVWHRKPIWMRNAIICGYKAETYRDIYNLDVQMLLKEDDAMRRNRMMNFYSTYHEEEEEKMEVNQSIIELNSLLSSTLNQPARAVFEDDVDLLDPDFQNDIDEENTELNKIEENKSIEIYHANPILILTLAFRFILFLAYNLGLC